MCRGAKIGVMTKWRIKEWGGDGGGGGGGLFFFFFKQKTAYEIYQCDWSSDVCSSDLPRRTLGDDVGAGAHSDEVAGVVVEFHAGDDESVSDA